jgi:hypothetical protein
MDWLRSLDRRVLWLGGAGIAAALALVLAASFGVFGSGGDDGGGTTTTVAATPGETLPPEARADGVVMTVTGVAAGSTIPVAPGTEIAVRLPTVIEGDLWRMTTQPDAAVLAFGGSMLFVPSDPEVGEPYQEFIFTANAAGTTSVTLSQGAAGDDTPTFTFTVVVIGG